MNAQELRIGNLVNYNGKELKVAANTFGDVIVDRIRGPIYDYTPIQLTPDWLERFGFTKTESDGVLQPYWMNTNGMILHQDNNSSNQFYCLSDAFMVWLPHVHILQNLHFALTGSELELQPVKETQ